MYFRRVWRGIEDRKANLPELRVGLILGRSQDDAEMTGLFRLGIGSLVADFAGAAQIDDRPQAPMVGRSPACCREKFAPRSARNPPEHRLPGWRQRCGQTPEVA